jgi:2,3-diketo-5-methylthio-1-phosphopentane phosphatase
MRMFVSDFDGTITEKDVANLILDKYAYPQWLEIEKEYKARKIGTREAINREFALVKASREELTAFVDEAASLDPHFKEFLGFLGDTGEKLEIVSEGLDFYIRFLLKKWGLDLPLRTNRTSFKGRMMNIAYPHRDPRCSLCGTCKMGRVLELRGKGYEVVYFGNGYSDICPALEADKVFAKGQLTVLCEEEDREFMPFNDFGDVVKEVRTWR